MRFALLFITAGLLPAEEITKVVDIKYVDKERVNTLIIPSNGVVVRIDPSGKFIVFRGEKLVVESMEEVLRRIDVAPVNVELVFELLSGSKASGKAGEMPQALNGVVKEMKTLFGFQTVSLIDTIDLRTQEGREADSSGRLTSMMDDKDGPKATYSLHVRQVVANGPKGSRQIRIGVVRFNGQIPMVDAKGNFKFYENYINTSLDIKEGQRVVVGKVGLDPSSNPFFLVVSAKVVE